MNLKENDMGVITRDEVREILEEIIKDQSQINKAENTNDIESKPTATSSTEVPWWKGEPMIDNYVIAELLKKYEALERRLSVAEKHIKILEIDRQIDVMNPSWRGEDETDEN